MGRSALSTSTSGRSVSVGPKMSTASDSAEDSAWMAMMPSTLRLNSWSRYAETTGASKWCVSQMMGSQPSEPAALVDCPQEAVVVARERRDEHADGEAPVAVGGAGDESPVIAKDDRA